MKKYIIGSLVGVSLFSISVVSAKPQDADPFALIWAAIGEINAKLVDLQNQIMSIQLIPGPQGEKGDKGDPGETKGIIGFAYIDGMERAWAESGTYSDIPGRVINYSKKEPDSILKITYQDQFLLSTQNSMPGYCSYQILVDGNEAGSEKSVGRANPNQNLETNDPLNLYWIVDNLPIGDHRLTIQMKRGWGSGSFEQAVCQVGKVGGMEGSFGLLFVEEISK